MTEAKRHLRTEVRARLSTLPDPVRQRASAAVRTRLLASETFLRGGPLLGFVALPDEIDVLPALQIAATSGREVLLPRWNPKSQDYEPAVAPVAERLRPGPFGVLEPPPDAPVRWIDRLDLILVPGVAFDRTGRRLGRGKGFFDRLLARATGARRWGIAFDQQIVDEVPTAAHDVNVHLLVTPELWLPLIDCGKS
ncbi:MAG: 5-formyltetrahydrofolate cyclo-ligase [Verrucomicrobiales bacterium]|nr:5-formyltetrahydrofolate cyclo-ligase [Verrucomicrobiales bacterium]